MAIIKMCSRRAVMSGEVVTFATEFEKRQGGMPWYSANAAGPFEVSASRDAVVVHRATCRNEEELDTFITALRFAHGAFMKLHPRQLVGHDSIYPEIPTICVEG